MASLGEEDERFLVDLAQLPADTTIESLTIYLLQPEVTDSVFPSLAHLLPEIAIRWQQDPHFDRILVLEALGKIVPFIPHLRQLAHDFIRQNSPGRALWDYEVSRTRRWLLALYRLSLQDRNFLDEAIKPSELLFGLNHETAAVRYLTVRLLSLYLNAADASTEKLIRLYAGDGEIPGEWEEYAKVDYGFFSLRENERSRRIQRALEDAESQRSALLSSQNPGLRKLWKNDERRATAVAGVLLPISQGPHLSKEGKENGSHFHPSLMTSRHNLQAFIDGLCSPHPVLLVGQAGSGKSSTVRFAAQKLGKEDSMITLHLNEQSDAKTLLGLYTSGSKPGTFEWKAGVLTTAVREGRWVLIEDLDRAPNEIISALLPLIERNELHLPSRGETIRAANGFKLIATIRTASKVDSSLGRQILGVRFWKQVQIQSLQETELLQILKRKYRGWVAHHADALVKAYSHVKKMTDSPAFISQIRNSSRRPLTTRDLLKWCNRSSHICGSKTQITDDEQSLIFLEAVDCFAGHFAQGNAFNEVASLISASMSIEPPVRDALLSSRQVQVAYDDPGIHIGRVQLSLRSPDFKKRTISSNFSANPHTLRVLEKVAAAVSSKEPLLLIGETGTGKTTVIQALASLLGKRLVAVNLSQQSESADLLGGFKPVSTASIIISLQEEFEHLFLLSFSRKKNADFQQRLSKFMLRKEWSKVCKYWRGALSQVQSAYQLRENDDAERQKKRQRRENDGQNETLQKRWERFGESVSDLESRLVGSHEAVLFAFVEGNIVKAVRNGDWVLLDEINLASPDTLEALVDLLASEDKAPSLLLTEAGNVERVVAHPEFRIFAAMNPATDVGKRDLPQSIRSRFTELFVEGPDKDVRSLEHIVQSYLDQNLLDKKLVTDIASLYLQVQRLSESNNLVDGSKQKPHFSLRTLTRCLTFATDVAPLCNLRRGIYEGFHMTFLTHLDNESELKLAPLAIQYVFGQKAHIKSELGKPLRMPNDGKSYIEYGKFWLRQGRYSPEKQPQYIITPFVQRNLNNLVRAVFSRRYPVLIQGPTSSGKTSMIEYLARVSGNKFVRVNNHEHTDLQEYLGSYVSDSNGKLAFKEGILVEALRNGYWIVLDELNLAPTDILEALNRLLDDNRELFVPETQETVHPHPDFMLFATQNPAGLYGGRKPLSRAFRNRFLELHFDDIPVDELCDILHQRTQIPESWARRIVEVYKQLSSIRQENRIFEQKSFATLRDLFRWALRKAGTKEELAINGFLLLGERVRKEEERIWVKKVIEEVMGKSGSDNVVSRKDSEEVMSEKDSEEVVSKRDFGLRLDLSKIYAVEACPEIALFTSKNQNSNIVWTKSMRRLYTLVAHAMRNNEPVLLIGETGCGKTSVCQMLADAFGKQLSIINAHQNTDTGDLIGSQRPIRNRALLETQLCDLLRGILPDSAHQDTATLLERYELRLRDDPDKFDPHTVQLIEDIRVKASALFQWCDGSLVTAMKEGQFFLLDEISLAEDSVLERLNSVLEPERTIFLAEKAQSDGPVAAIDGFQFFATMNPGGDYGKRELSPALRNRFTEIWVPPMNDLGDVQDIIHQKLRADLKTLARPIVKFASWFGRSYRSSTASLISIRDVDSCVDFVNASDLDQTTALLHGIALVYIDSLGANPAGLLSISASSIPEQRRRCVNQLAKILHIPSLDTYFQIPQLNLSSDTFRMGAFTVSRLSSTLDATSFTFEAPTTRLNAMRIVRALSLSKPILIEGDPGVGKTTLVTTIARLVGKPLTRINLSEQTDLMDLFGSDIPAEGASVGTFEWRDAPFLTAMKNGDWVLLDEMNLASQSVLEGLNACLDHRGEAFVAELDQSFHKHADFRLFAAQNPHHQGGGRKGLPASFVNRFTVVYADAFEVFDLRVICERLYPKVPAQVVSEVTAFAMTVDQEIRQKRSLGSAGSPWEINLRDVLRVFEILTSSTGLFRVPTSREAFELVFQRRFRSAEDRLRLLNIWQTHVQGDLAAPQFDMTLLATEYQLGMALMKRDSTCSTTPNPAEGIPRHLLTVLQDLMVCVERNWPAILVGNSGCGKTALLHHLAAAKGAKLMTLSMNGDIDSMDLVGGYEQTDPSRRVAELAGTIQALIQRLAIDMLGKTDGKRVTKLFSALEILRLAPASLGQSPSELATLRTLLEQLEPPTEDSESIQLWQELEILGNQIIKAGERSTSARFEWVNGILVQAIENGDWLVLDNANLCSSSVLDRLNSLLEPAGVLVLNEHPLPDGSARVIARHQNFRIFLTMDPRYGELSNAMRNRSVELYCETKEEKDKFTAGASLESSMHRYSQAITSLQMLPMLLDGSDYDIPEPLRGGQLVIAAMGQLLFHDLPNLSRFESEMSYFLDGSLQSCETLSLKHMTSNISEVWDLNQWRDTEVPSLSQDQYLKYLTLHPFRKFMPAFWGSQTAMELCGAKVDLVRDSLSTSLLLTIFSDYASKKDSLAPQPASVLLEGIAYGKTMVGLAKIENNSVTLPIYQEISASWVYIATLLSRGSQEHLLRYAVDLFHDYLKAHTGHLNPGLNTYIHDQLQLLDSCFRYKARKSGKQMETLWPVLRPHMASTIDSHSALLELGTLIDELDTILQEAYSRPEDIRALITGFQNAWTLVRANDVGSKGLLLADLRKAIDSIRAAEWQVNAIPSSFSSEFDGIIARYYLWSTANDGSSAMSDALVEATTRSRLSIKDLVLGRDSASSRSFLLLHRLSVYSKLANSLYNSSKLLNKLLSTLRAAEKVSLREFSSHKRDLTLLGHLLSVEPHLSRSDNSQNLSSVHNSLCESILPAWEQEGLSFPSFSETSPNSVHGAGILWIQLGLVMIKAYVPDRAFDPLAKRYVDTARKKFHGHRLQSQIEVQRAIEQLSTGRRDNIHTRYLEAEIAGLEDLMTGSQQQQYLRPGPSRDEEIQDQFNLILRVGASLDERLRRNDLSGDITLAANITRITNNLGQNFRGYDDILVPVVGMLHLLLIGLALVQQSQIEDPENEKNWLLSILSPSALETTNTLSQLRCWVIKCDAESNYSDSSSRRVRELFHQLFLQWKSTVKRAQAENADKSSLYTFRGTEEDAASDEEHDFEQLFPGFYDDSEVPRDRRDTALGHENSIEVCDLHESFVSGRGDASIAILELARSSRLPDNLLLSPSSSLSIAYLRIKDEMSKMNQSHVEKPIYNFYQDRNPGETNRMMDLAHRIRQRFEALHQLWPDHATISDAIGISGEIFNFQFTDPVAKFLPKCEKLHDTIHEWQTVASKDYSAVAEYSDLTTLLVDWRRLELNTWARLFDLEVLKCEGEAKNWWYLAYELIFGAPRAMAENGETDMENYALNMAQALREFLDASTLGQYESRIHLLSTFTQSLQLEIATNPELGKLYSTLYNLLAYHERFQSVVITHLQAERIRLEKGVKDVIQLASWRDTNIKALRESAKASHRKLFKFVRKFRELLHKPAASLLQQEVPNATQLEEVFESSKDITSEIPLTEMHLELIRSWFTIPAPYEKPESIVRVMNQLFLQSASSSSEWIGKFLLDFETSKEILRKETPLKLTDENKEQVTHLKTRKRMLFADVLKEARRMGLQYNLSNAAMSKQESFPRIISNMGYKAALKDLPMLETADYYLHKVLSICDNLRSLKQQHSGDLSTAEVTRSSGYLEAFLQQGLMQRNKLLGGMSCFERVKLGLKALDVLACYESKTISSNNDSLTKALRKMKVLVGHAATMLRVTAAVIAAQSQLGELSIQPIKLGIEYHADIFNGLRSQIQKLDEIPFEISSDLHKEMFEAVNHAVSSFKQDLESWSQQFPAVAMSLEPLQPIAEYFFETVEFNSPSARCSLQEFQDNLLHCLDTIRLSMQRFKGADSLFPDPVEDANWLVTEANSYTHRLESMRMIHTNTKLEEALKILPRLPQPDITRAFQLLSFIRPILDQYSKLCFLALKGYASFQASLCKLHFHLAKTFLELGKNGFCTPQESAGAAGDDSEKLEGGTGLGDGEGAENISKDIGDDEDLTELAEEPHEPKEDDGRDDGKDEEQDAVDMADADLEGETKDVEKPSEDDQDDGAEDGDDEEENIDDEVGDVDDLGEDTLDEKMWDSGDATGKEKENDQGKGARDEEQLAPENGSQEIEEPESGEGDAGDEQDASDRNQHEAADPYVDEGEKLDLPEDMDMDNNEANSDSWDHLSDELDDLENDPESKIDDNDVDSKSQTSMDERMSEIDDSGEMSGEKEKEEDVGSPENMDTTDETNEAENEDIMAADDANDDLDDISPQQAEKGTGQAAVDRETNNGAIETVEQPDQNDQNDESEKPLEHTSSSKQQGRENNTDERTSFGQSENKPQSANAQESFKQIGDILEKWYNQNQDIHEPTEKKQDEAEDVDVDMAKAEFEHLEDQDSQPLAQAIGAATQEQAMGMDDENEMHQDFDESDQSEAEEDLQSQMEIDNEVEVKDRALADVGLSKSFQGQNLESQADHFHETNAETEILDDELAADVSSIHLSGELSNQTLESSRATWAKWESSTRILAATLAEQLRLILAPTLASKLRGDFRTGKRLNIKRIIPYIASSYKRDKIWMRRSVPSKRNYQIMIALDDSKSMADEQDSGQEKVDLAFQTLALIAKALSILETGELSIVGFGQEVNVAHSFGAPFTDEAGGAVFDAFKFTQEKTNMKNLVQQAARMFQAARATAKGTAAELWQLLLIVSDGVCDDHKSILHLVRRSQEERIMIVFVIVDKAQDEFKAESIMDLQTADFIAGEDGEPKLVRRKYMDTFPFPWWIVVRDVRDLPNILSGALRQWFVEIAESS